MTTLDVPRVAGPDQPAVRRRHIPVWLAIVAASLPMFMATLDNLVMTSALPVIQVDLGLVGRPAVLVHERLHAHLRDVHAPGGHAR